MIGTLGDLIRQAREARGWEQEDLGLAIGKSGGYISTIEGGRKKWLPEPEVLHAIATEIDVPMTEMLRAAGYLPTDASHAIAPAVIRQELTTTLRSLRRAADALITFQDVYGELLDAVETGDQAVEANQQPIADHPAPPRRRKAG